MRARAELAAIGRIHLDRLALQKVGLDLTLDAYALHGPGPSYPNAAAVEALNGVVDEISTLVTRIQWIQDSFAFDPPPGAPAKRNDYGPELVARAGRADR